MGNYKIFQELSPTFFADVLSIDQVMDISIRPLWPDMTRIAGPAFTVQCAPGDQLMLHAALYRAAPGSVIVVQAHGTRFAVCGGNVCAIAKERGIAGFVVDGVVRDVAEAREMDFPLFARGISPKPGIKERCGSLNEPIFCGGIQVCDQDVIVADEEGILVIPEKSKEEVLAAARKKVASEAGVSLAQWRSKHEALIASILREKGFNTNNKHA